MVDPGHMNLYDRMDPPLRPGDYRLDVSTAVALSTKGASPLPGESRYLRVEGPRFSLLPQEVAGVFPPRNAVGIFEDALPQVVLGRRTLAWEREADEAGKVVAGAGPEPPLPDGKPPWLALLLFSEAELPDTAVRRQVDLTTVLPPEVRQTLGLSADERTLKVDAIDVDAGLLSAILPGLDELQMLTHVREVSVEDRELSAGDSDGWFTVVMGNRLPAPGKWRACLVSLEGRDDVFNYQPPAADGLHLADLVGLLATADVALPGREPPIGGRPIGGRPIGERPIGELQPLERPIGERPIREGRAAAEREAVLARARLDVEVEAAARIGPDRARLGGLAPRLVLPPRKQLILLHSWSFECEAGASFQELCRGLDVGLFSEIRPGAGPAPVVTDTGHLALQLTDRAGGDQLAWYRGPLVPWPVTRDPRGPYHSADQCRRISPETGLEDVAYAAAFEVGRLLAAADARLAQELMRWRRRTFRRSVLLDVRRDLRAALAMVGGLDERLGPRLAARLTGALLGPGRPFSDPFELGAIRPAEGLQPELLARAWRLASPEQAAELLGPARIGEAGGVVPGVFERPAVDLELGAERDLLTRLAGAWLSAMETMDLRRER
ncbi:MAG: hypothetical protein H6706_13465 [Myxococcales bacterium]|nr:hypothetical protein [Myxococcales bacterium]